LAAGVCAAHIVRREFDVELRTQGIPLVPPRRNGDAAPSRTCSPKASTSTPRLPTGQRRCRSPATRPCRSPPSRSARAQGGRNRQGQAFYKAHAADLGHQKTGPIVKLRVEAGAENSESRRLCPRARATPRLLKSVLAKTSRTQNLLDAALARREDKEITEAADQARRQTATSRPRSSCRRLKAYAGNYRSEENMTEYQVAKSTMINSCRTSGFVLYRLRPWTRTNFQATQSTTSNQPS